MPYEAVHNKLLKPIARKTRSGLAAALAGQDNHDAVYQVRSHPSENARRLQ